MLKLSIALCLALSLVACKGKDDKSDKKSEAAAAAITTMKGFKATM